MSDDLERDLRTMLARRANDIAAIPDQVLGSDDRAADGEVIDLGVHWDEVRHRARRHWPLLLAAAAVVAALVGVLVTGLIRDEPAPPPAGPVHTRTVVRASCAATLPPGWRTAITRSTAPVASLGDGQVVAVTEAGGAVVEQSESSDGTQLAGRLGYVTPGGSTVRWVATFTAPSTGTGLHTFGLDVDVTGTTAVVTVEAGGQSPTPREIVAVDLESARRTVLARSTPRTGVLEHQAYALDGVAYWQARKGGAGSKGVEQVLARAVDGGPVHTVAVGGEYDLEKSALGIEWNLVDGAPIDRPAPVPDVVTRHATAFGNTGDVFDSYVTDGAVYAWQTLDGALEWYDPSAHRIVRVPHLLGVPFHGSQAATFAVAGPLVYFQDEAGTGDRVLDVRTGAVVPVPTSGELFGRHGRLIGSPDSLLSGGASARTGLLRLDGTQLPAAHC